MADIYSLSANLGMGQSGLLNNMIDRATGKPLVPSNSQGAAYAINSGMGLDTYNQNIKNWLETNNTATDAEVRTEIDKYNISPLDVANAMGWDPRDVVAKYDAQSESAKQTSLGFPTAPAAPAAPQQTSGGSSGGYQKNPYLDEMAQGITSQMNDNWTRNLAPSIRSGAMAAGGFGGSRQGVVEANGLNDMNRSLGQNLTNLYGTDYTNSMNRNLQQQQISNGYDLGLRSNDVSWANYGLNESNSNATNQLNSAQFGLNAYNTMGNYNTAATGAATTVQNAPLDYFNSASNTNNKIAGQGGATSGTLPADSTVGAIGGATMANDLYKAYKGY